MAKQIIRLTENDLHRIVKQSVNKILKESSEDVAQQFSLTNDLEGRNKAIELRDWLNRKIKEAQDDGFPIQGDETEFQLIKDLEEFINKNDMEDPSDEFEGFGDDWDEETNYRFERQHGY